MVTRTGDWALARRVLSAAPTRLQRAIGNAVRHEAHALRIQTVGADKGYFAKPFLTALVKRRILPHIAAKTTGREAIHQRVRRLSRTVGYQLSQRARKKIEELWGEAKCWHGFRRFQRRGLLQVRDEAYLMGWLLNLKRLATLLPAPA